MTYIGQVLSNGHIMTPQMHHDYTNIQGKIQSYIDQGEKPPFHLQHQIRAIMSSAPAALIVPQTSSFIFLSQPDATTPDSASKAYSSTKNLLNNATNILDPSLLMMESILIKKIEEAKNTSHQFKNNQKDNPSLNIMV